MSVRILATILTVLYSAISFGQDTSLYQSVLPDSADLSGMSIEELSKMRSKYASTELEKTINQAIEAASRKPLPLRKAPSIISVISEDEIIRSGARTLMDVLRMVPGIEFNVDVEGVVALSFRGLWANEGNISLQIDGQEVNEIAYASIQLGDHYHIGQIKKVEIIRGPGSAIYGGCAEYAVINIVTKKGEDIKGAFADITAGQTQLTHGRQAVALAVGDSARHFKYSVFGSLSRSQRSDRMYSDVYGNAFDMKGNSDLNNAFINASVSYKDLSLQFVYDNYQTTNRDANLRILSKAYPLDFLSAMTQLKYKRQLGRKLQLSARLSHKYSEPWTFKGTPDPVDSEYSYYLLHANTYRANAGLLWDPIYWLNVNVGFELYNDRGQLTGGQMFRSDSIDCVSYMNYAPYTQLLIKSSFANVTIGARYDISTAFGHAFNPRLGITKKVGMVNFKLLYASSFRAPAIESFQYSLDAVQLKPERSQTLEFEASVKIGKNMYLSANLFDISTVKAIRYFVKTDSVITGYPDGYRNSDITIGSQGLELEYKYKAAFGFINLGYSYYTTRNKHLDDANMVPGNSSQSLGTARNKLNLQASFNIGPKIFISPSVNWLDKRYGYSAVDANENGILTEYKPQLIANLYVGSDKLIKNMMLGIGVANLTDEQIIYPQAYNSLHAPLPGMSRELYCRLNYYLPFKRQQ